MIDLTRNEQALEKNIAKAKEQNIIIPTIAQMKNPELIPDGIKEKLKKAEEAFITEQDRPDRV